MSGTPGTLWATWFPYWQTQITGSNSQVDTLWLHLQALLSLKGFQSKTFVKFRSTFFCIVTFLCNVLGKLIIHQKALYDIFYEKVVKWCFLWSTHLFHHKCYQYYLLLVSLFSLSIPFYNLKCQIDISKQSQLLTVILPYFSHYAYCYFMFSHNNEVAIHDLIPPFKYKSIPWE